MIKIKDTLAPGSLAGAAATIPQLVFDFICVQLGLSKYYAFQISGAIYLLPKLTEEFFGMVLGGARIVPVDIPTNLTIFIANVIFGLTMGYLIVRWGDELLFDK